MTHAIEAEFEVTKWEEEEFDPFEGAAKLTRATVS